MSNTRTVEYALTMGVKHAKGLAPVAGTDDWLGTAAPVFGATDQFLFDELDIKDSPEMIEDDSNTGSQLARDQDISIIKCDVSGKGKFFTKGFSHFLSSVLGYEDIEGPKLIGSNYAHLICFASQSKDYRAYTAAEIAKGASAIPIYASADRYNPMVHLCRAEGPSDVIAKNVQLTGFTLSVSRKDALTLEFSGTGESVIRDETKAASNLYAIPTGTFEQFYTLRSVTTSQVGPVGAMVEYHITDFKAKGKFGVAADIQTTKTGTSREFPYSDGQSTIDVEFTVFLHTDNVLKGFEKNQSAVSMKLGFARGTEQAYILIPYMKIKTAEPDASDAGSVKVTAKVFHIPIGFVDPFTAERSLAGAEQALDGPQYGAFYMVVVDGQEKNGLRMA